MPSAASTGFSPRIPSTHNNDEQGTGREDYPVYPPNFFLKKKKNARKFTARKFLEGVSGPGFGGSCAKTGLLNWCGYGSCRQIWDGYQFWLMLWQFVRNEQEFGANQF
jgi:hypothetical protein